MGLFGLGSAILHGAKSVLPGSNRREIDRLTEELQQIDQTLTGLQRKGPLKRPPSTQLSSCAKRPNLERSVPARGLRLLPNNYSEDSSG